MTIGWDGEAVMMLDQRLLPEETKFLTLNSPTQVIQGIKEMAIRGAPAIGCAAALGLALGAAQIKTSNRGEWEKKFEKLGQEMTGARPTAVNLAWAVRRMVRVVKDNPLAEAAELAALLRAESEKVLAEDVAANKALGRVGAAYLPERATVLTHCNAGALATGGYGTALGVVRAACEAGKKIEVIADETRPFLQGARLTAWELAEDHIPVKVITDSMAGALMAKGLIDAVIVGADRIAANGDVANKIGTYTVAVLAMTHHLPFYVAAPLSTIDPDCSSGEDIPIEERDPKEVTHLAGRRITPQGVGVYNPAFDVTPARYVSAIFTERGAAEAPYAESIKALLAQEA
ncbi:MAG: S-methyl-5-thioribose-1-phosphate isomerase [Deltaproteobacteria bacterium]|nr:S-methyl-5-thioribose-1-phosphate isomerase [Deltaproteobacteria bacterium]